MQGIEGLTAKAGEAIAQRDTVQANLLELDASFGKRMLEGAALTGETARRWETARADLRELWETFGAYTAVVDRLAELTTDPRAKSQDARQELAALLSGRPVTLTRAPAPLGRRDLADTGRVDMTLAGCVAAMREAFGSVTEVTAAAEAVWAELTGRLDPLAERVAASGPPLENLNDEELRSALADARARLDALRGQLNADPLALWRDGRPDTSAVAGLADRITGLADRIAALDRLRHEAAPRLQELRATAETARAARRDAAAGAARAAARVTGVPSLPEEIGAPPLDALEALAASGRWARLAAELARCESALEQAQIQTRDAERIIATLLAQRSELRGLLDAYKAKAARLGAEEDPELGERYQRARDLLWTGPCDLEAAGAAVREYQRVILDRARAGTGDARARDSRESQR